MFRNKNYKKQARRADRWSVSSSSYNYKCRSHSNVICPNNKIKQWSLLKANLRQRIVNTGVNKGWCLKQRKLEYSMLKLICQHILSFQHRGSWVSVQLEKIRHGNKPTSDIHIFTILLQWNSTLRAKHSLITDNFASAGRDKANIDFVTGHIISWSYK